MTGRSRRRIDDVGAALASGLFALSLLVGAACAAFDKGDSEAIPSGSGSGSGEADGGSDALVNSDAGGETNTDAGAVGDTGAPPGPRFCASNPGLHWICEDFDSPDGGIQAAIDKTPSSSTSHATIVPRADAPSTPNVLLLEALAQNATASVFKSVAQTAVAVTCTFAIRVRERPSAATTVFGLELATSSVSWRFTIDLRPNNLCASQVTYEDLMGENTSSNTNCMLRDNEWTNVYVEMNPKLPRLLAKFGTSVVYSDTTPPFTIIASEQVTLQIGPAAIPVAAARVEIDNVVCDRSVP